MDEIFDKIDDTFYKLELNDRLKETMHDFNSPIDASLKQQALLKEVDSNLIAFCEESNGYIMHWINNQSKNIIGKINILRLEHILKSWKDDLYFKDEPLDSQLRIFRPIDQFSEEAHCGILLREKGKQRMYFHSYGESELFDLMIDFLGYIDLALEAKGFFYWQKYLLEYLYDIKSEESENFKTYMPQLFDDFSMDKFNKKIDKLKLK